MDEIITAKIKEWATREWWYQMTIALLAVVVVVSFMSKQFKAIADAMPSVQKFFSYVQRKWFSNAIFRADVLRFMNTMQLKLNEIEKEVKPNGGGSMNDKINLLVVEVKHLRGLRDISDKFDGSMKFRFDPEQGVTFISESFLKFFGHKESDVMYYAYAELIDPDDVPDMYRKWERAISTGTPFRDTQRVRDIKGHYHECEVKADPIVIDRKIKEYVGVIDIIN